MQVTDLVKLFLAIAFGLALWGSQKARAMDCEHFAAFAYQAVYVHQVHGLERENYHVIWSDEDEEKGNEMLNEAFETDLSPFDFATKIYGRCTGQEV